MKQVIVLRKDLEMSTGKCAAQAAHASLTAFLKVQYYSKDVISEWFSTGQTKIVVMVQSEQELLDLYNKINKDKTGNKISSLIRDEGRTELKGENYTSLAIGPYDSKFIDGFTKGLKLYK